MNESDIWDDGEPLGERFDGIEVPEWIDDDISPSQVAAIVQGGCDSGAYMPAVNYSEALAVMQFDGDDVLQYLEAALGEVPSPPTDFSWAGIAVFYLSAAVEQWAHNAYSVLEDWEPDEDEDDPLIKLAPDNQVTPWFDQP